ncbi:hypothetical protein HS088_TW02G00029 [Tripterygium wilfordii]|uniref:Uncharacterized protein n=1 Tax=Tripterygium wilfordii TaxID=458696 RepID=A0A7J7DXM2_TRIWF|nr:hypothetical protein HS088_TW02G00029 [Tripterygium wilfordii]
MVMKLGLQVRFKDFLASRKVLKKAIHKVFGNLNGMESKRSLPINNNQEAIVMLEEVEAVTLNVFESLLLIISGPKASKLGGWSILSKLKKPKRIACEEEHRKANEFKDVDAALFIPPQWPQSRQS